MGRSRKPRILEEVRMTGMADRGKSVGRIDEKVIFVDGAVPGDVADVLVQKKRKGFLMGKMTQLREPSPDRVDPFCKHFGVCGGCKWQHLDYDAQVKYKEEIVHNALARIGKVEVGEYLPILKGEKTQYYRNKLEYSFSNKRWLTDEEVQTGAEFTQRDALGFHRPGAFDKIVDVEHCHLQPEPSNAIRNAVREFALEHKYEFFDIRKQVGFLRQLYVRITELKEVMIMISFFREDVEQREALLRFLEEKFPEITTLGYYINDKKNDTVYDLEPHFWSGPGYIHEELNHVRFRIGPKSFFQTNTTQAVQLYDVIREFADLKGHENVYDLYTGLGSIACYVAADCKQVTGIEEIEAAIVDARINAKLNNINNTTFYAGDVKDILTEEFITKHGKPDLVITDPPRPGMHADVVKTLLALAAPEIVYVSCNPATQARDLQLLSEKYEVVRVRPVDMFPHTHHIENVALLRLITSG